MNRCDVMVTGGDVLDLAVSDSSLPDHAVAVVGRRIAEVAPRAEMLERWDPARYMMLGWNTMRHRAVPKLLAAGVPLVLGSDYSPSMIASPFDLIHAALVAHRESDGRDDALVLEDAVAMATNSGVPMGRPGELGSIRGGQLADIVVLDTTGAHHIGSRHPIPAVALRGRPSDVRTVLVDGAIVADDGEVTTIDTHEALDEATAMLRSIAR